MSLSILANDNFDLRSGASNLGIGDVIRRLVSAAPYASSETFSEYRADQGLQNEVATWISAGLRFESNSCTRLHALKEDVIQKAFGLTPSAVLSFLTVEHTFVMRRDWAAVLDKDVVDGDFMLPFDKCVFEFRISGKSVLAMATQRESSVDICTSIDTGPVGWIIYGGPHATFDPLTTFVTNQIRAMCIALEAEVGVSQQSPAGNKLNEKRARNGRVPISDYHVVELSKRVRGDARVSGAPTVTGKIRLHFRRGHYRQVGDRKTWVKWCLAGNPDLGFVPHHYSA